LKDLDDSRSPLARHIAHTALLIAQNCSNTLEPQRGGYEGGSAAEGELLALHWRDVDFDAGVISIRRSVGLSRVKGEKAKLKEGKTKNRQSRVVDVDESTMSLLRTLKRERGSLALARDDAIVFGDAEGRHRHPERFSRSFKDHLKRCRKQLEKEGTEAPPEIRLHDLRHTHATLLLRKGRPVHIVSRRLGHKSEMITLSVYTHAMPGDQREAADSFAALVADA
jgi:integrase